MSTAGALAVTGAIFAAAALTLAIAASQSYGGTAYRLTVVGWTTFAFSVGALIAAVWTAALA